MFGCDETITYADAWVDGELDPGAALMLETHVRGCARCREEVESIRIVKRSMAALRESDRAPTALRGKVLAMLDAHDGASRMEVQRVETAARRKKHAAGFALAGATLAGVVAVVARTQGSVDPRANLAGAPSPTVDIASMAGMPAPPPVVENLTRIHARELPAEVQGNQPQKVADFFRGKMDVPVHPVEFRGVPAHLTGARFANVQDRTAATLYYDVGGRRVSVFVFDGSLVPHDAGLTRQTLSNGQAVLVGNAHGYTVTFSEQDGVGYAITTDMPPPEAVHIFEQAVFEQQDIQ